MAQRKKTITHTADGTTAATLPILKAPTKALSVVALLKREEGVTLAEMVDATGWQSHTARAMLTGLRKKGHVIERRKRDDVTCYYLPAVSA